MASSSSAVRSAVLFRRFSPAGGEEVGVFTCPPNVTTLLKSVYISNTTAGEVIANLYVDGGPATPSVSLFYGPLPTNTTARWEGWLALAPGYRIVVGDTGALHWWGSGAVLPGVVQIATTLPR